MEEENGMKQTCLVGLGFQEIAYQDVSAEEPEVESLEKGLSGVGMLAKTAADRGRGRRVQIGDRSSEAGVTESPRDE
jgi:hypothetical protein